MIAIGGVIGAGLFVGSGVVINSAMVQMALNETARSQLVLSLLSWGVVLVLFLVTRARGGSVDADDLSAASTARGDATS